jgi:hypothetical protein
MFLEQSSPAQFTSQTHLLLKHTPWFEQPLTHFGAMLQSAPVNALMQLHVPVTRLHDPCVGAVQLFRHPRIEQSLPTQPWSHPHEAPFEVE